MIDGSSRRRVVVLGATGNLGTATLDQLTAEPPFDVVGVARRPPSADPRAVEWRSRDVTRDDLAEDLRGADALVVLTWAIHPPRDVWHQWEVDLVGTRRALQAAGDAGVGTVVVVTSVSAYSPGERGGPVGEDAATDGVPTLGYSWQKAYVERQLDAFEARHPDTRLVRLRPALVFQRRAAMEIRRYFIGRLAPTGLLRPGLARWLDRLSPIAFQAVHAEDVGRAVRLAVERDDASGPFNLAATPRLGVDRPHVAALLRAVVATLFRLRLIPTAPGWIDLARVVPWMDTTRARDELGWVPRRSSIEALAELLGGLEDHATGPTPVLEAAG